MGWRDLGRETAATRRADRCGAMAAGGLVVGALVLSLVWVRVVVDFIEGSREAWHETSFPTSNTEVDTK